MKPLSLFLLLVLACTAFSEDRRHDKSHLKVMSFNCEFLWDGIEPEEGRARFDWKFSETEAREKMVEIAKVIERNSPDIVVLLEVENINALNLLNDEHLAGQGYVAYLVDGKDTHTGQDVGLLTRVDPEDEAIDRFDNKGESGTVSKSVSKNMFAKFDIGGQKIALIGIHFLAFPDKESRRFKRQAQADATRDKAVELSQSGYNLIVAGDWNDYDNEVRDHLNNTPITNTLKIVKTMDPANQQDDLVNVAMHVPAPLRFTSFWDKDRDDFVDGKDEFSAIDHVLVSDELNSMIKSVEIPHDHNPITVSDHYPIIVTFETDKSDSQQIRILEMLPNPEGNENENEWVALLNTTDTQINLDGWKLKDLANTHWNLTGTVEAFGTIKIMRSGQKMALNNSGDTISLINDSDQIVDVVKYARVAEEETVEF